MLLGKQFQNKTTITFTPQPFGLQGKTPILRGQNHGSFGSKVWHFWVLNRMVLDREIRAEGWMISPTRLRHFPESTPTLSRVDSAASRSRLLYLQPVDSAEHSSRLGDVAESTPIPSTSRLGGAFDSTRNCKDCKP